jgi:hypothetical protein
MLSGERRGNDTAGVNPRLLCGMLKFDDLSRSHFVVS